jgi:hypothetical protein
MTPRQPHCHFLSRPVAFAAHAQQGESMRRIGAPMTFPADDSKAQARVGIILRSAATRLQARRSLICNTPLRR